MERGTDTMRSAERIASDIADRGGSLRDVLEALSTAADSLEHGWSGAAFMGYTAGCFAADEDQFILDAVYGAVADAPKSKLKSDLSEILGL